MTDIFISYKREEHAIARRLADALEDEGWTVWWDPKLRAGEYFDDVIEKALNEAKCVIVLWSNLSMSSEYVKAEAAQALEQKKLIPVMIESVTLPFRFKRIHARTLSGWNGSRDATQFRDLLVDISAVLGPAVVAAAEQQPPVKHQESSKPASRVGSRQAVGATAPTFLMPIDDVFQITGRGTLVTGVVTNGTCKVGDEVAILKDGTRVRRATVTAIELFRTLVDRAEAGDSIVLMMKDVSKEELEVGMIVVRPA
jgi:TIR domain/Elongation factor Tu domain 2